MTRRQTAPRSQILWAPRAKPHGLTFVDIFCGAGGSSSGLANAGWTLKLGANHWARAIETHQANFPDADHLCADVNNYDFRRLPKAQALWASPICTESSPAGGTAGYRRPKQSKEGQLDIIQELGHVEQAGMERTRATFMDVIRYLELHRPEIAFVENVPDVVDRWILFDWWLLGLEKLGYVWQVVSVSSAHIGAPDNAHAPQWRDRLYIVCARKDLGRVPDVRPRPLAWCFRCEKQVRGEQFWCRAALRRALKVGKYRRIPGSNYGQYWYVCPNGCRNEARERARVEPFISPAAAAIDWTDLGVPIADLPRSKDKPDGLAPNTLRRIRAGFEMFGQPITAAAAGNTFERGAYVRAWPAFGAPMGTRQCTDTDAVAIPPMLVPSGGTWADDPLNALDEPMRTQLANPKGCEAAVFPEAFFAMLRRNGTAVSVREPAPTITAGGTHHALIVPYYTKGVARDAVANPFDTVTTLDRFAFVRGAGVADEDIQAARYRMIKWRESARAQRFDDDYEITGNEGERTMQAGNAVSVNAAQWLGEAAAAVLTGGGS